ncbi:hypothetical protein WAB17_06550 [Parerythrobacter aurantius]|uniref:hypothetical protein n=1 Tax=Parerythrobacter aurantius TaxID=3127706 RepID=UPI003244CD8F
MATSKSPRPAGARILARWRWGLFAVLAAAAAVFLWFRTPIGGYAETGTAYAARVGCSCRFVAGRTMEDCAKDKLAGMELVTLSEDAGERSVTARFLLLASDTARLRDGYGCVLDRWQE